MGACHGESETGSGRSCLEYLSIALYHAILKAHWQTIFNGKVQLEAKDLVQPQLTPGVQTLLSHWLTYASKAEAQHAEWVAYCQNSQYWFPH